MKKWYITSTIWIVILAVFLVYGFVKPAEAPKPKPQTTTTQSAPVKQEEPQPIPLPDQAAIEANLNEFRASRNLAPLADNPTLDQAAQARAESMCAADNWSHNGWLDILNQYYVYSHAGENLYYNFRASDQASAVIRDWENSPSHLENLVGYYTQVGTGVKLCPLYQGQHYVVLVTEYYGVPR